jgi:hypothetical protein
VDTSGQLVVVGDRFAEFLNHPGTIAASQLAGRETAGLVAGQGLSADVLAGLAAPVPVRQELTHKRLAKNVMIGEPYTVDDGYAAPLLLDERCETLEDHLTGQHIPAVALTEAARQTWTAVTEMFYPSGPRPTRFVIDELSSRFRCFVFPLPATLFYRVLAHERDAVQRRFHAEITVHQSGVDAAQFDVRFRVVLEKIGVKQEFLAARQALARSTNDREVSQA